MGSANSNVVEVTIAAAAPLVIFANDFGSEFSGFFDGAFGLEVFGFHLGTIGAVVSGNVKTFVPAAFVIFTLSGSEELVVGLYGAPSNLAFNLAFLDGAGNPRSFSSSTATVQPFSNVDGSGYYWTWNATGVHDFVDSTDYTITVT